jgi:KDO2-lipid IV(A) lauroyltransferase
MDALIYWIARSVVALIQALPLTVVARLGRAGGALAHGLSARYRRVVRENLTLVFGKEMSPEQIRALAKENFRRIGENYACAIKTSAMTAEQLKPHVEFAGIERLPSKTGDAPLANVVVAIGHFGNFELYARFHDARPEYQCATTYRALPQPALNRLLLSLRNTSGCHYFERRDDGPLLRAAMNQGGIILGLLADQSSPGLHAPFLGHDCYTGLAPAVLALRYHAKLYTGICYRTALAQWRIELGEQIPTHADGQPRPSEDIMRDVNRDLEKAVRRDPANWFWVHRRWKKTGKRQHRKRAALRALLAKQAQQPPSDQPDQP